MDTIFVRFMISSLWFALGAAHLLGGQLPRQWFFGTWDCRLDGRPARMEWLTVDDPQTVCSNGTCTTTSGVKLVGRFRENSQPWVELRLGRVTDSTLQFRHLGAQHSDGYLSQDPRDKTANGWSTWNGTKYAFACADAGRPVHPRPQVNTYYRVMAKHSQMFLDVTWASSAPNARVGQAGRSDTAGGGAQLWQLIDAGNGWYRLQVKHSGMFLDVTWADKKNGAAVGQAGFSGALGGAAQLWRLVPALDGWYRLQAKHSSRYLDVTGGSGTVNAPISQSDLSNWKGGAAQLWRFVR